MVSQVQLGYTYDQSGKRCGPPKENIYLLHICQKQLSNDSSVPQENKIVLQQKLYLKLYNP